MKFKNKIALLFSMLLLFACTDSDLDPILSTEKDVQSGISNLEDLQGISNGMHDRLTVTAYYGRNMMIYGEVRSDNCFANGNSGRFLTEAQMTVNPDNSNASWEAIYAVIASANIIINVDKNSISGDKEKINQIIGQAYIVRAMAHFDLLRLYGQQHAGGTLGIPYVKNYKGNDMAPPRNTVAENKIAFFNDIETGLGLMLETQNPKVKHYISTFVGQAVKARIALYFKEWEKAKNAALAVFSSGKFNIVPENGFVGSWKSKGAENVIFELAASSSDNLGINGLQNIYRGSTYGDIEVLDNLTSVFDKNDIRNSASMIGMETVNGKSRLRNLGKYPVADFSDNIALIRFEEVVLILAEALMETGDSGALEMLNRVPAKRGATLYTKSTKENVLLERRKELCFEGFRFDDLARTGSDIPLVDIYKQTHGGPKYGNYKYAFPIPTVELVANSKMTQNNGYQ